VYQTKSISVNGQFRAGDRWHNTVPVAFCKCHNDVSKKLQNTYNAHMSSATIGKHNNIGCYFITFTVIKWYYLFDRFDRWRILADSLNYCIKEKNLKVYGFVFMLNHMHLLFFSPDAIGFVRDYKKFTSKALKKNILDTEPHVLSLFLDEEKSYHFWQPTNMPIFITSEKVFLQKLQYIYNNPVKKQYVSNPEDWYWSSANRDCSIPLECFV
jgi:REP element-mobilizing transposase RayT